MDIKKERSLYSIFLRYLISFCLCIILLIVLLFNIFSIAVAFDIFKPANYVQNEIEKLKLEAYEGCEFNEDKIPYPSGYIFLNDENEIVKTNLEEKEIENFNINLQGETNTSKYFYSKIQFSNGICIIRYDIKAHFTSVFWNKLIPYPEMMLIGVFFIGFIIIAIIIGKVFGKKLKKELYPVKVATEKIMSKDLEFEIMPSKIKEFNEVLGSISNMKIALKDSLEAQWHIQEEKKNQICALAHDIKTPITVIKGNAELLNECELSEEDRELAKYIINNADKIEKYVSTLIDISNSNIDIYKFNENIKTEEFLDEIKQQLYGLSSLKNIKIFTDINYKTKTFISNKELLMRAITNIILNAVDYSPVEGNIEFIVKETSSFLSFTIKDSGKGFTNRGLKNATSQFYMEAKERKVGKHYGMGLYIAETVAKSHGGYVNIKNREDKVGAEVSLVIDLNVFNSNN